MIEIYEGEEEIKPKRSFPWEFDSTQTTIPISQIYDTISEYLYTDMDDMSEGDYESTMFIYLPHGDIWMNCGITPPSEDLKLWTQDVVDRKVSS